MFTSPTSELINPSSFRDPSGLIFWKNGHVCRKVGLSSKKDRDLLPRPEPNEILTARRVLLVP